MRHSALLVNETSCCNCVCMAYVAPAADDDAVHLCVSVSWHALAHQAITQSTDLTWTQISTYRLPSMYIGTIIQSRPFHALKKRICHIYARLWTFKAENGAAAVHLCNSELSISSSSSSSFTGCSAPVHLFCHVSVESFPDQQLPKTAAASHMKGKGTMYRQQQQTRCVAPCSPDLQHNSGRSVAMGQSSICSCQYFQHKLWHLFDKHSCYPC